MNIICGHFDGLTLHLDPVLRPRDGVGGVGDSHVCHARGVRMTLGRHDLSHTITVVYSVRCGGGDTILNKVIVYLDFIVSLFFCVRARCCRRGHQAEGVRDKPFVK